jgi:hypothetical protein
MMWSNGIDEGAVRRKETHHRIDIVGGESSTDSVNLVPGFLFGHRLISRCLGGLVVSLRGIGRAIRMPRVTTIV